MQTLITALPLCSSSSTIPLPCLNSIAIPHCSVQHRICCQSALSDRLYLFLWGCLSSSVSASVTLTLMASQQITTICTVTHVTFSCTFKRLLFVYIFLPKTPTVHSIANLSQNFKVSLASTATCEGLRYSSNVCFHREGDEMNSLCSKMKPSYQNVIPFKEKVTTSFNIVFFLVYCRNKISFS